MSTDSLKLYIKHATDEERIEAWKSNRVEYSQWRSSSEGRKWVEWVRKKQQDLCFICLLPLDHSIHVDHIFPLYLGGTNVKTNLCVTHPKCNMDKGIQVYLSYKQACRRRRQFNTMRRAKRTLDRIERNPKTKVSKKQLKAIKLYRKFVPIKAA